MLVDEFFEALEGGALQQATLVSLVPPGGPRSELVGAAFKSPALRHLRIEGWCWFNMKCGHLTALTSLVRLPHGVHSGACAASHGFPCCGLPTSLLPAYPACLPPPAAPLLPACSSRNAALDSEPAFMPPCCFPAHSHPGLASRHPPNTHPSLQELGKGACPYLHHLNPGSLPPGLARLRIEDDGEGDALRYALLTCVRQLGGTLRHLHLATAALGRLPLRHLGALSGLTSLQLASLDRDAEAAWPFGGGEWGDSGNDSDSDGSDNEDGDGASARAEDAAWASGAAGPLLPAFSRLTTLTHVQLGVQSRSRTAAAAPEFVWRLPHLKVRARVGRHAQPYVQPGCCSCCRTAQLRVCPRRHSSAATLPYMWPAAAVTHAKQVSPSLCLSQRSAAPAVSQTPQVASLKRLAPGPGFAQHAAELPLEALSLDLATATAEVAPAALAALPALRLLELTDLPPALASRSAAEALLGVVLAPPQLAHLTLHAPSLRQLRRNPSWAWLLDEVAQRRPGLAVGCTGRTCTLEGWPCGTCLAMQLLHRQERQLAQLLGQALGQPVRRPACFDG